MKKTLVSALTTAIVVGAASTTFAAANPFEDVPADHWAYDAIAQLAADGVIEGYGDGTYRGDQEITRYEMAQMIARAMAKGGGDKALIDKLAAEFADELNNLGVRVAALEKKVDNVKWKGEIRYQFVKHSTEKTHDRDQHTNFAQLRLKPSMQINKNWTGMAGIYYGGFDNKQNLNNAQNVNDFQVKWTCVQGVYGKLTIDLGKTFLFTNVDEGMVFDDYMAGGKLTYGKDLKFSVAAGRTAGIWYVSNTSSYVGGELTYNKNNFNVGVGYHYFANDHEWQGYDKPDTGKPTSTKKLGYKDGSANIWTAGLGYRFGDFRLFGAYAQNTKGECDSDQRKAYTIQLEYKGAKLNKPGSFGLEAGYRHLGVFASLAPTYDYTMNNIKGWFVGGKVTLMPNVTMHLGYCDGKTIDTDLKDKYIYSRFQFFF